MCCEQIRANAVVLKLFTAVGKNIFVEPLKQKLTFFGVIIFNLQPYMYKVKLNLLHILGNNLCLITYCSRRPQGS